MERWVCQSGLVAVAALAVVSCSPVAGSKVLGKWHTPTGGSIEFKSDGTAIMAGPVGSREVRYSMIDEHRLEFSRPDGAGSVRWEILSVGDEELIVKGFDGVETRLTRGD
jgi:hypothetical protein